MGNTARRSQSGRWLAAIALLLSFSSCASFPALAPRAPDRATTDPAVVAFRQRLVEGANSVLGRRELVVRGKRFNWDCTGVVLAIYWYAGVDLSRDFDNYRGGGVRRLYKSLEAEDLLYTTPYPLSGDLIFWDNTLDENGDGIWNDPLTHVGMAVSTEPDGTVSYIHHHVKRGIVIERMNLFRPDAEKGMEWGRVKIINSPMRLARAGVRHPPLWLAGQLYRILGMGYFFR
jgi:hypothetical protein